MAQEILQEMAQVPEQNITNPSAGIPPIDTNLSFKNEDFAEDMAKLLAQQTEPAPAAVVPVPPPTTPAQPNQAAVTPEAQTPVPEKFRTPDGQLDKVKLEKSTLSAEEALAKYLAKEKELKRKINEVKAQENAYLNPPAAISAPAVIPVNVPFAEQLEADIAKDGAGVVLSKLFTAAQEAAEARIKGQFDIMKAANRDITTRIQLEEMGKQDPWIRTNEAVDTLSRILGEQPYLWKADDPYKAAYIVYQGMQHIASRPNSQVLTPIPSARPTAPTPSGQAANRVGTSSNIMLNDREAIDKHLKTLTVEQQSEFFVKLGYPAF